MSSQIEINENGIYVPQTSEVKEAFQNVFVNAMGSDLSLDDSTPQGDLINELTLVKQESNTRDLFLLNQFNPNTAEGIFQDAIAGLFGLERKEAQPSIVTCQCIGSNGTVIPLGMLVQSEGNELFESLESKTIGSSGTVNIQFRSVKTGAIPCSAHTVDKIYTSVSGLDSVDNATAGVLGYDEESRSNFEDRRKKELARNATGSLSSVYSALYEIDDVRDVFVWENDTNEVVTYKGVDLGKHSIYVCLTGGDSSEIAEAIYKSKSAGCDTTSLEDVSLECTYTDPITEVSYTYNYFRPTLLPTYIKIGIGYELSDDAKQAIKDVLLDDWNGKFTDRAITIGSTIYASRFYKDIDSLALSNFQLVYVKVSNDGTNWEDVLECDVNILPTLDIESTSPEYITFEVV